MYVPFSDPSHAGVEALQRPPEQEPVIRFEHIGLRYGLGPEVLRDITLSLAPGGQGTVETVEGDLKARVRLLGSMVENAAAPAIRSAIRVESETGQDWLASRS